MLFDEYLLFEFQVSKAGSRTRVLSMCFLTLKNKKQKNIWCLFTYLKSVLIMKVMLMMSTKMMMISLMKTAGNITAVIKELMKKIKVVTVRAMAKITVMVSVFI